MWHFLLSLPKLGFPFYLVAATGARTLLQCCSLMDDGAFALLHLVTPNYTSNEADGVF